MRRECAVFFGISILVLCNILLFVASRCPDQSGRIGKSGESPALARNRKRGRKLHIATVTL